MNLMSALITSGYLSTCATGVFKPLSGIFVVMTSHQAFSGQGCLQKEPLAASFGQEDGYMRKDFTM